jgi:hypothetical protein
MTMFTLSMLKRAALLVLAVIASQGLAQAQTVGLLTGTQLNPDQFYVGAHAETPPLIDRLTFRPSIEDSTLSSRITGTQASRGTSTRGEVPRSC